MTASGTGATRAPGGRRRRRALPVVAVAALGALAVTVGAVRVVDAAHGTSRRSPVQVTVSAREYTAAGLRDQARALRPGAPLDPTRAESVVIGPIGTPAGVLDCLDGLDADVPRGARVVADVARYQGRPAVVVVVDDDGTRRAWVTERVCTGGRGLLAGPVGL